MRLGPFFFTFQSFPFFATAAAAAVVVVVVVVVVAGATIYIFGSTAFASVEPGHRFAHPLRSSSPLVPRTAFHGGRPRPLTTHHPQVF